MASASAARRFSNPLTGQDTGPVQLSYSSLAENLG